jgi:hypothetical protein
MMVFEEGSPAERRWDEQRRVVEEMSKGMTLRQLRLLTDEDVEQRHDVLMDPETGVGQLGPDDYRRELDRRATYHHAEQVEIYAKKLDQQTTALTRLTYILAALTAGLFILEVLRIAGVVH